MPPGHASGHWVTSQERGQVPEGLGLSGTLYPQSLAEQGPEEPGSRWAGRGHLSVEGASPFHAVWPLVRLLTGAGVEDASSLGPS